MSKNIIIQQDGIDMTFQGVSKLKLKGEKGQSSNWVWTDETGLGTLHPAQNGTYVAANDGYYGYDAVVVSGVGATSFVAQAGDRFAGVSLTPGDEYAVILYGEERHLRPQLLPSKLVITHDPTKTTYQTGEAIDLDGAVVKAYTKTNAIWNESSYPGGIIPNGELTITPSKADHAKVKASVASDGTTSVSFNNESLVAIASASEYVSYQAVDASGYVYSYGVKDYTSAEGETYHGIFVCSTTPFVARVTKSGRVYDAAAQRAHYNDNDVYYAGSLVFPSSVKVTEHTAPINGGRDLDIAYLAWLACFGERISQDQQNIKLSWRRPFDEKELSVIQAITVTA